LNKKIKILCRKGSNQGYACGEQDDTEPSAKMTRSWVNPLQHPMKSLSMHSKLPDIVPDCLGENLLLHREKAQTKT